MNDIRKYVKLIEESYNQKKLYDYVGNCVNSFDEDTMEYLHSKLSDINDLSVIDEEYVNDENHDPTLISKINGFVPEIEDDSIIVYVDTRDMIIIYNPEEDIHYFYE